MAEFQEVVKQAKRLCRAHANSCTGCPLADQDDRCLFEVGNADCIPEEWKYDQLVEAERIVIAWAKEHPEPVYPSWHDAWKQLFPDSQGSPCPEAYGIEFRAENCVKTSCATCKARPMHAEVAEKLGVKPLEVFACDDNSDEAAERKDEAR